MIVFKNTESIFTSFNNINQTFMEKHIKRGYHMLCTLIDLYVCLVCVPFKM